MRIYKLNEKKNAKFLYLTLFHFFFLFFFFFFFFFSLLFLFRQSGSSLELIFIKYGLYLLNVSGLLIH